MLLAFAAVGSPAYAQTAPAISSITPQTGPLSGGTSVTIQGSGFSGAGDQVSFGGVLGTITADSTTSITVTTPSRSSPGPVDVTVTTAGGQSVTIASGFVYLVGPTTSASFSPSSIPSDGSAAATLTITVTNPNPSIELDFITVQSSNSTLRFSALSTNCPSTGGAKLSSPSPGVLTLSNVQLAGGASCTVTAQVTATAAGPQSLVPGGDVLQGYDFMFGPYQGVPGNAAVLNVGPPTPVTPAPITSEIAADKTGQADVTTRATGGPFTSAAVVSVAPVAAGTAEVVQTSGTAGVNATFAIKFAPALHFSGPAVVTYTLSNGFATSAPGTVTFSVAARADPTADPDVKGLIQAQVETAHRFAEAQLSNFNGRLETLHGEGPGQNRNGISLAVGDGGQPGPDQNAFLPPDGKFLPNGGSSPQPRGLGSAAAAISKADGRGLGGGRTGSSWTGNLSVWAGGAVDFGMHKGDPNRSKLKFSTSGVTFGADYRVSDLLIVGAGVGYGLDQTKVGTDGTKSKATSWIGALYGSLHESEQTYVDGAIGYGKLRYDSRRWYAAAPEFELGKRDGDELFASLTFAWEVRTKLALIAPYGRIDAIHARLDPFTETGGVGALAYAAQSANSLKSTLGVHGDYLYRVGRNSWQPRFRLEYQHEFEGTGSFALTYADWLNGPTYRASTDPTRRDHFLFGLGTDYRSKNLILSFDFKADVDNGTNRSSEVRAKAVWNF